MAADILFVLGSYILGSVPHLSFLARLRHIRLEGDYHQSLWQQAGKIFGILGVLGEFIKGVLPVLIGRAIGLDLNTIAIAGLAVVCGQMWPIFSKFEGEKGNSIAIAMVITLIPKSALVAIFPIIIALVFRTIPRLKAKPGEPSGKPIVGGPYSRSLPLGMAVYFLILPLFAWYFGEPAVIIWCCAALLALILVRRLTARLGDDLKTGENIKRILIRRLLYDRATAGEESQSSKATPDSGNISN
jgi:glycerol-3-phosphate acyltransferase PlsY